MLRFRITVGVFAAVVASFAWHGGATLADGFTATGVVGGELRFFPQEPRWPGQDEYYVAPSVFAEPEFHYEWNGGEDRLSFVAFGRGDYYDDHRTHGDLREGYWLHQEENWDVLVGVNQVFWGVTESRHLVNIINQIDQVEDIDEEDFLGQPMVNLNVFDNGLGRLGFYVMSGFREREFAEGDARLRGAFPVDRQKSDIRSDLGHGNVDVAVRYDNTFGPIDVGLYHFYGLSREPRFELVVEGDGDVVAKPIYDLINQTGLEATAVIDDWLLKFEGIVRSGHPDDLFFAMVGGFEYTMYNSFDDGLDIGLLAEYLYDGRDVDPAGIGVAQDAPPTVSDNDVFVGTRLTFNDVDDTNILAGAVIDVDTQATAFTVEASRRLNDQLKIELDARTFFNVPPSDPLTNIENDDFVQLRLLYFY